MNVRVKVQPNARFKASGSDLRCELRISAQRATNGGSEMMQGPTDKQLRVEIPKIFEQAGSIFVYATTEPEEALLLGGNTATLWEGRVTQFGPTPDVYRRPRDATTARDHRNREPP